MTRTATVTVDATVGSRVIAGVGESDGIGSSTGGRADGFTVGAAGHEDTKEQTRILNMLFLHLKVKVYNGNQETRWSSIEQNDTNK